MQGIMYENRYHFLCRLFSANIRKPTQMSGFIFGGPLGPKFELFQ